MEIKKREPESFIENDFYTDGNKVARASKKHGFSVFSVFFRLSRLRMALFKRRLLDSCQAKFWLVGLINSSSALLLFLFFMFNSPAFLSASLFLDARLVSVREYITFSEKNLLRADFSYMAYVFFKKTNNL